MVAALKTTLELEMNTLNVEQLVEAYAHHKNHASLRAQWIDDMFVVEWKNKPYMIEYGYPEFVTHAYSEDGLGWHKPQTGILEWRPLYRTPGLSVSKQHDKTRILEQVGIYKGRQKLLCQACLPNGNEHVYNWVEKMYQLRPEMFGVFTDSVRMGKVVWSKQDVQNLQRVHDRLVEEQDERELLEADSRPFALLPKIDGWKRIESGSELKALAKEFRNCCFGYLDDCVEGNTGFYRVEWEGEKICVCIQYMEEEMGLSPWTKYEVREAKYPCNVQPSEACMEHLNNVVWNIERL